MWLPAAGQKIYLKAFNHALEEYNNKDKRDNPTESPEEVAYKVAWAAVKKKYKKGTDGKWYAK